MDELNFCEYEREGDGATRHVFQCFCECDDLDALADQCCVYFCSICCSCCTCCDEAGDAPGTGHQGGAKTGLDHRERLRRVFMTIEDRTRVPWIGGARRVNAGMLAAPLVLRLFYFCVSSWLWAPWVLLCLGVGAAHLIWLHVTCLGLQWRTHYFVSWIAFSIAGIYWQYVHFVMPAQDWFTVAFLHVLLVVTGVSYACAVLYQVGSSPGGKAALDRGIDAESNCSEACKADALRTSRTYPCRVCGHQVHRRDHHCVWINQCVGSHNHRAFVCFVASFALLCLSYSVSALGALVQLDHKQTAMDYLKALAQSWTLPPELSGALYAGVGGLCSLALALGQAANIGIGLTTHERKRLLRIGGGTQSATQKRHWQRHPFDQGSLVANWMAWFRNQPDGEGAVLAGLHE